ncbi:hypothetical protein R9C00_04415 [Flammeovirgaceae bacterium SG7u.111]|nr:hypothetical protein [Flammeovirgaceae bacterium SG7u.132]WPO36690.1 hypothetical protein R9C00_04415 [Flammeovirgaceae bacterium SG7u.111]
MDGQLLLEVLGKTFHSQAKGFTLDNFNKKPLYLQGKMKITAIILTLFISFLAIKPGVDMVCSTLTYSEIDCCDVTCTPDKDSSESQSDDCSGEMCNPFKVCNSCSLLFVYSEATINHLFRPELSLKRGCSYQLAFTSHYISDFWQPPKFV